MEIIETLNLEEARRKIDKLAKERKKAVVLGQAIEFNRKILENKKVSMLILNHKEKNDKLKQRDSGLNQVLCKIAKENEIEFAIDFSEILSSQNKERAEILGRWMQNIMLINKYKNKVKLINKQGRDDYDLRSLLVALGMRNDVANKAVE